MTGDPPHPTGGFPRQGLVDTNILLLRRWVDPAELPDEMAISAITLAELSAGPHQVRPNSEQDLYDEHEERARRTEALQRAESEFDPVPFDAEAARIYGRVTAAVAAGRKPRRRIADLMIAATAISEDLPLYTTNPGDYAGLEKLVRVVPVTRPPLPHEMRQEPRLAAQACPCVPERTANRGDSRSLTDNQAGSVAGVHDAGLSSFQRPSETTSMLPSVTLMAV
jgi:predicted nucleic acid-binding protein